MAADREISPKFVYTGGVDIANPALLKPELAIFGADLISRTFSLVTITELVVVYNQTSKRMDGLDSCRL